MERPRPAALSRSEQATLFDLAKRVKSGEAERLEVVVDRSDGRLCFRVPGERNVKG